MASTLFSPKFTLAIAAASALWIMLASGEDHAVKAVGADEALAKLKAGNERFTSQPASKGRPNAARRAEVAQTQHPFAVIVACSDSRTAPELVFDQNIGDLFVIRVAGNLVDDYGMGSIEYAVEHLGARLIVVLGHERCGAVKAALAAPTAPGHIGALVRDIQPAVQATADKAGDKLALTVHANATAVAAKIWKEAHLGELASEVKVVTGYYDLDSGVVEWE